MAAILISVNDIKYLKTWLAINEESIYNWTAFRNAFFLVSTYASAPIPTKQRPYAAYWGTTSPRVRSPWLAANDS
jgi:hypothetical protein